MRFVFLAFCQRRVLAGLLLGSLLLPAPLHAQSDRSTAGPAPTDTRGLAVATFGGGCFWSFEEIFEELRGVQAVVAGYSGGKVRNPSYEEVCSATTGHAESVQVYYDPRQLSYQTLLEVFLLGAHDPTTRNRQGPDAGPQYRSVAFYRTPQERQLIEAAIRRVDASHHYSSPVVTQVAAFTAFWPAESYHQGYYRLHPENPYLRHVSQPKVEKFRKAFPDRLKATAVL
ncbi:peptide-methionine (S)-S-oxide reductase MsrA [Hymenobacter rigui]|uniref:Peptide methionine sulfoxide reductase MsrA n=1 Tax=Hymenobacter rigui TaxID=334424 RepID=A0A3R9MW47_9BACT|nr:peptide-methionine (S)-S-oxide reductase MsrA [Hymenobacter rigui]RSK49901.1 peptide-methionine (S)-S-oxide reductase [Hymenobacter rigui]